MFTEDDIGNEVKVRETSGTLTRGAVVEVGQNHVTIHALLGDVRIDYPKISTVTRIGDQSNDNDRARPGR